MAEDNFSVIIYGTYLLEYYFNKWHDTLYLLLLKISLLYVASQSLIKIVYTYVPNTNNIIR